MNTTFQLRPQLDPQTTTLVRDLVSDAAGFDSVSSISEQPLTQINDKQYKHLLGWTGNTLSLYANIDTSGPVVELLITPEARWEGIGSAAIAYILDRFPEAKFWAYGNLPSAQGCAQKLGAKNVRELLQLERPIGELSGDAPQFRHYHPKDAAGILNVNNAAFSWHPEQGNWTEADFDRRTQSDWFDPHGLLIAEQDDTIIGFVWTKIHKPNLDSEIYVIAVHPDHAGAGLGGQLVEASLHYSALQGCKRAILYVEADNAAALKTYTKFGYTTYQTNVLYQK